MEYKVVPTKSGEFLCLDRENKYGPIAKGKTEEEAIKVFFEMLPAYQYLEYLFNINHIRMK